MAWILHLAGGSGAPHTLTLIGTPCSRKRSGHSWIAWLLHLKGRVVPPHIDFNWHDSLQETYQLDFDCTETAPMREWCPLGSMTTKKEYSYGNAFPDKTSLLYVTALVALATGGLRGLGAAPRHQCALGPRGGCLPLLSRFGANARGP